MRFPIRGVLTDRFTLLENQRAANGAGGWTDSWVSVGVVYGALYTRATRANSEKINGGRPVDPEYIDIAVDTREVTPDVSYRVQAPDGRVFEILDMQRQNDVAFLRGRLV